MDSSTIDNEHLGALLVQAAAGDERAFEQLYKQTHRRVYAYLMRSLNKSNFVDDVLVETYTEVWKSAARFKGEAKVTTWIIGIARNLAMNHLRKDKNKHHEDISDHPDLAVKPLDPLEAEDARRLMSQAMTKLSLQQREILGLVLLPEMNYPEIADLLDIPVNTVKTRVFYAKEALKEHLQAMGVSAYDI